MQQTKQPETKATPERKQVGIHIEVELWRKFRGKAVEQGVQAGYLVEQLIRDYLKEGDK